MNLFQSETFNKKGKKLQFDFEMKKISIISDGILFITNILQGNMGSRLILSIIDQLQRSVQMQREV